MKNWCVLLSIALGGCLPERDDGVYMCDNDLICGDRQQRRSMCLYDGSTGWYCADLVFGCPTGLRWSPIAPHSLRDRCVTQDILDLQPRLDGGTADATAAIDAQ